MTQTSSLTAGDSLNELPLRQLPAFSGLSEAAERRLRKASRLVRFRLGQDLSEASVLPAQVFVLLRGSCRLLHTAGSRLTTLARLGPGSFVGLASLLRAAPCEAVTAAEEVVALALPDELIVELYGKENSFRCWHQLRKLFSLP